MTMNNLLDLLRRITETSSLGRQRFRFQLGGSRRRTDDRVGRRRHRVLDRSETVFVGHVRHLHVDAFGRHVRVRAFQHHHVIVPFVVRHQRPLSGLRRPVVQLIAETNENQFFLEEKRQTRVPPPRSIIKTCTDEYFVVGRFCRGRSLCIRIRVVAALYK